MWRTEEEEEEKEDEEEWASHWPVLVGAAEAGQDHVTETAGSVQFRLTLGPLDGALQPSTEEALEWGEEDEEEDEEEQVFRAVV